MAPKSPPKKSPQKSQSPKKSPQKSPKKSVKKGKEAVADEILPPPDDISKLDESALTELAKSYRLDSLGNKTVILDRIIRFLKTKNLWKSKQVKKKRGKKKKRATGGADDEGDEVSRELQVLTGVLKELEAEHNNYMCAQSSVPLNEWYSFEKRILCTETSVPKQYLMQPHNQSLLIRFLFLLIISLGCR